MEPAAVQVPAAGSYSSAALGPLAPEVPATSIRPEGKSVAVQKSWGWRVSMGVSLQVPVAGS